MPDQPTPDRLDSLFDAVRGQPPPAPFAPAAAVRRRGRQRAHRQVVGAGVAVLAVVGLGAGGAVTVAGRPGPAPPPAASTPAPDSPGPSQTVAAVPAGWLLTAADLPGGAEGGWERTGNELLESDPPWYWGDLCEGYRAGDYPSLARRVDLTTISWRNDQPPIPTRVDQLVELFESRDLAAASVADVRRVISGCSRTPVPDATVAPSGYRVVTEGLAGEQSLLIEMASYSFDGETIAPDPHLSYAAVIRVGRAVTTLISGDRGLLREVSPAVAARLR